LILALAMSLQLARPPDAPPAAGEPSRLSLPAAPDAPLPYSEPLPLRAARALPYVVPPGWSAAVVPDGAPPRPVFYAMRVNGQAHGVARLLVTAGGRWLARRADLETWRLRVPAMTPVLFAGEEYFPLDAYAGMRVSGDDAAQALELESPAEHFVDTVIEPGSGRKARAVTPSPGGFFNYDVSFSAASGATHLGGLFEGVFFNRLGVGTTTLVANDIGSGSHAARLDTTWRRDFPDEMKTLLLGDAIGASGSWGRPVRYGGVRYGTNFATNPAFITFPLPDLRGEAVLPTTTELYVDGVLRQSTGIAPGPFRINNLPVVTGQGEVRLVVRDLLGREQVVSLPYYASSTLLAKGLTDDSYEIGFVREDYGIRSTSYGRFVSAFQRRKGFTDELTGEARAEILREQQTLGAAAAYAPPRIGIFTGALAVSRSDRGSTGAGAASRSDRGSGALGLAAFERQVRKGWSFAVRSQWTTADFTQVGIQPDQRAPIHLASANAGVSTGNAGSFGLAYVVERRRDQPDNEIVSANYSVSLTPVVTLIAFALKPLAGSGRSAVGVTLSLGLGGLRSASLSATGQRGASEVVAQIQQNLPTGPGWGYRGLVGNGARGDREEAGVAWQTGVGTYTAEVGRADDRTAFRAGAAGGIAMLDGRPFVSRRIEESFGVAHVPGFADVGILLNNQIEARTDAQGYAMLPRLLPYQSNLVRVDTGDLPLDTEIESAAMEAVPYYRSGVLVRFPIERAHGALLTIVLADGKPLPVASVVRIVGGTKEFPVAERGEVYVTGLAEKNRLRATWRGQSCELDVALAPSTRQPRIGPLVCAGVSR
jgi:outer membrane usher protein